MTKFVAKAKDGTVFTRNSKTKSYTHCRIAWHKREQVWFALAWSGSAELAEKAYNGRYREAFPDTYVVEVEATAR